MLISVKYHGATNTRGSKWIATMEGPAGRNQPKIRRSHSFTYGKENGAQLAAELAIRVWESAADLDRDKFPGTWAVDFIGESHEGIQIWRAVWTYDADK